MLEMSVSHHHYCNVSRKVGHGKPYIYQHLRLIVSISPCQHSHGNTAMRWQRCSAEVEPHRTGSTTADCLGFFIQMFCGEAEAKTVDVNLLWTYSDP